MIQKSRSNWILSRDRNTRFFHLYTIIWRRKAKITSLKNVNNCWIDDLEALKIMVNNHFTDLFSFSPVALSNDNMLSGHPILSESDNRMLNTRINLEIWEPIKGIHPYKARGPDGIQAVLWVLRFASLSAIASLKVSFLGN